MSQALVAQGVPALQVLGRPFPPDTPPLVGRARESADLAQALTPQLAGAPGPPVLVTGGPGVGKTRLVQEFLSSTQVNVVRIACPPAGGSLFQVPSALVRLILELQPLPSAESLSDSLREGVARHLPGHPNAAEFLGVLQGLALPAHLQGLDPRSVRLSAFGACRALLRPHDCPIVLLVEDVQWADAGSVEFLDHLARVPLPPRAALVVTSRPNGWPDPKRSRGETWRQVPLEPLLTNDAKDLLGGLAGDRSLPPSVESWLVARSAGVPGALEEGFLSLVEEGLLVPELLHYELPGGAEGLEPARPRRFTQGEQEVLAAVALLVEEATEPLLEEALGRPAAPELGRLVQRGVLQRWVGPYSWSPVKCSFLHPSDQELALAALPAEARVTLHRRAFERTERLLDHSTLRGPALSRTLWHAREAGLALPAVQLADRAGDVAREANLPSVAVDAYTAAIDLRREGLSSPIELDPVEWSARGLDLLLKRAEALVALGKTEEATRDIASVRIGYGEMGDKKRLCRAKLLLSRAFERAGDLSRMLEEAADAARLAGEAGDEEFIARAQATVADAFERRARYDEALSHAEEARTRIERLASVLPSSVYRSALAGVGLTIARVHADRGQAAEGLAEADKAIQHARAAQAQGALSLALELTSRLSRDSGDLAHARLALEEALSIAESRGDRIAAAADWAALGRLRRDLADASGAADAFRAALLACEEMGDRVGVAAALANVGHLAFDQGDLSAAAEAFREVAAIRAGIGDRVGGMTVRLAWAEAEAERGANEVAEARLEEALATAVEMGARVARARGLLLAGRMRRRAGDLAEASSLHEQARELAYAAGATREHFEAGVELGFDALARGRHEEAARSLEVASRAGGPLEPKARLSLLRLDAELRLARGEEALPQAEEALTLAHRSGLRRLVPQALDLCARTADAAGEAEAAAIYRGRAEAMEREMGTRGGRLDGRLKAQ